MRVAAISDLHGALFDSESEDRWKRVPECDLLLVGGDVCPVDQSHEPAHQRNWMRTTFQIWLTKQPAKKIVWIAGNHDFVCELPGFHRIAEQFPVGTYLQDEAIEIDGVKIYGTPWVPNLPSWAFNADAPTLSDKFRQIPDDTDLLLSHGPAAGIGDAISESHVGSPELARSLLRVIPEHHVFGHIHEGYGEQTLGDTTFHNVAHMDRDYQPVNPPQIFEM